jgi:hypothetical protein
MSDNKFVTADPQFGNARILRPYDGFDTVYNGKSSVCGILWSENGAALDANAGKLGYSPKLVRGLSVPFGARVVLWLPGFDKCLQAYSWKLIWRIRNLFDFRTNRIPYHLPKQSSGIADTSFVPPRSMVVIPASYQSITYAQVENMNGSLPQPQEQNIHPDVLVTSGEFASLMDQTYLPDGTLGAMEQGTGNPGVNPYAIAPTWIVHEVQAVGDELIVCFFRATDRTDHPNWEFSTVAGVDRPVRTKMTTCPSVGVYVFVGSAP